MLSREYYMIVMAAANLLGIFLLIIHYSVYYVVLDGLNPAAAAAA